ncbi:GNAT family N-acetyltransferase [Iodobacter sp. CM08]|uniref:GNAT family N-acetyltransferase n=1 Tax=Iodobacter sp. CM08 TaxID=3085902 RepID=UPI0029829854|nr:GNAT family N-acetyltransferase [Iodobacter sp. CM08]MDW5416028.1 GNAT family N-acetyltransferase [Iodobacter sp. CM08]
MAINPILLDFPDQFESKRLIIRSPRAGDGLAMHEAKLESMNDLRRYPASLPWAMCEFDLADAESYCRKCQAEFIDRSNLTMLLFLKETGQFIGASGLKRMNWDIPKFEIGYWCRSSLHGYGLITEAVNAISEFAFEHLNAKRLEIFSDDLNTASWRVAEKAGFKLEGLLKNENIDPDGTLRNTRVYAKIANT